MGGIGKIFAGWKDPHSPQEKTLQCNYIKGELNACYITKHYKQSLKTDLPVFIYNSISNNKTPSIKCIGDEWTPGEWTLCDQTPF